MAARGLCPKGVEEQTLDITFTVTFTFTMTLDPQFKVRLAESGDVNFILKTWLRESRRATPRAMPDSLFYNEFTKIIHLIIPKSEARILCAADDPQYIVAFAIGTTYLDIGTTVLHFCYTRPPFRRLGFIKEMMFELGYKPGYEIVATHWSEIAYKLLRDDLIYNPYILYSVTL